jgi:hypothetical protein
MGGDEGVAFDDLLKTKGLHGIGPHSEHTPFFLQMFMKTNGVLSYS